MVEEWRDIVGYEGWYQASNFGNIRSLSREVCGKSRETANWRMEILVAESASAIVKFTNKYFKKGIKI